MPGHKLSPTSDSLHGAVSPVPMAQKENTPLSTKLFKTREYTRPCAEESSGSKVLVFYFYVSLHKRCDSLGVLLSTISPVLYI